MPINISDKRCMRYVCLGIVSLLAVMFFASRLSVALAAPMGDVNFSKGDYDADRWGSEFYVDEANSTTYCMEPGWESPDTGTYSTSRLTKSNVNGHTSGGHAGQITGNWHDFCLVLYYGYGGKGYNASDFSSHIASSFRFRCGAGPAFSGSNHDAYLVTHFFLGLSYGHTWGTGDSPAQWKYYKTYYDTWIAWARQKAVTDGLDVDQLELYKFTQSGRQTMVSFVKQSVPPSTGSMEVKKVANNPDGGEVVNTEFNFSVSFSGTGAPSTKTFSLHDGETWTLNDIQAGVVATVTETANSDYITEWNPTNRKVTIVAGETNKVTVTCTNTRTTGSLTVRKVMDTAPSDRAFSFHVVIKRKNGTTYKDENFTLKHNESKTYSEIPSGYTYEVTENTGAGFVLGRFDVNDGATVSGNVVRGTIQKDKLHEVTAHNLELGYATVEKKLSM